MFKRIDADPEYGRMLVGQRNAFHSSPDGRWISARSIDGLRLDAPPLTTLIPSHGTFGEQELYCRALIVTPRTSKYLFSGDFFRCVPLDDKIKSGYLFAFLRSNTAFRLLRSISIGGKQQEQHPAMMWRLPIPRLRGPQEEEIHATVLKAVTSFDRALDLQDEASQVLEQAIEEAV
jgi:type I restriction enzyme S subunit